jgi:spoIIIJ-associated protein
MEWVETTGRTVEEAKDAALDQLGVDEQDAEFEVLEEPKLGLFGRVRSEARVRARVRPTQPRPKEDRRDKRRRKTGGGSGGGSGGGGRSASGGGGGAGGSEAAAAEDDSPAAAETTPAAPKASGGGRSGGGRRSNGGGRRAPAREREEESDMSDDVALADQADVAREFLDGLLEEFGASGDIQVNELDEDTIEVAVHGDSLGLLIGPKGNTLSALQEVTRTVVQRQTGARNGRLVIDVGGYRQKRREALERFTRQVADEVKSSGARRVLEAMHPADRKVVHDTANTIDGVHTTSEGEEPRRRVVILPD